MTKYYSKFEIIREDPSGNREGREVLRSWIIAVDAPDYLTAVDMMEDQLLTIAPGEDVWYSVPSTERPEV